MTGLALAAACAGALAQSKLSVAVQGQVVGTATLDQKLLPNGGVRQTMTMELSVGGQKYRMHHTAEADRNGRPVREAEDEESPSGKKHTVAVFGSKSVSVRVTAGGKTTTKTVPIPATGSIVEKAAFWFLRDKPKPGTVENFQSFRMSKLGFEPQKATYVGMSDCIYAGKTIRAHEIRHTEGRMWVDSRGLPIRLELESDGARIILEKR